MQITGTLKNAVWCNSPYGSIHGEVHDDANRRWRNGTPIWTSTVQEDLGGGLYRTRNSIYRVEFKSEDDRPSDLPSNKSGGSDD